jgi:hypothetical protein
MGNGYSVPFSYTKLWGAVEEVLRWPLGAAGPVLLGTTTHYSF